MERTRKSDIQLVQTCGACPEQYDAYLEKRVVGYLRLRHGYFSVTFYPKDGDGFRVYEAYPNGDGCFHHDEQDKYLNKAKKKIVKELRKEQNEVGEGYR